MTAAVEHLNHQLRVVRLACAMREYEIESLRRARDGLTITKEEARAFARRILARWDAEDLADGRVGE